jgi:hypothetical protein
VATPGTDSDLEIARALTELDSPDPLGQSAGRERLKSVGPEAVDILVRLAMKEEQDRFRSEWLQTLLSDPGPSCLIALGVILLLMFFASNELRSNGVEYWFSLAWITSGILFGVWAMNRSLSSRASRLPVLKTNRAQRAVASLDDVVFLGKLCEYIGSEELHQQYQGLYEPFPSVVARILPKASKQEIEALSSDQRRRLFDTLYIYNSRDHPELLRELLKLIVRCRMIDEIPRVRALAESGGLMGNGPKVRMAALETLTMLLTLEEEQKHARTLLRASNSPSQPGQTLLRPAADAGGEDPSVLLRPTVNGG